MTPDDESIEAVVSVVFEAADMHRSSVELTELTQLLPEGTTDLELESALEAVTGLRERYILKEGQVVNRGQLFPKSAQGSKKRERARANISTMKSLAARLAGDDTLSIAVSGSNSYLSAAENDDIDLFCVTRSGRMWLFLTRALIMSRVFRVLKRPSRPVCLSCVMDEAYARKVLSRDRGPLLARDALMAEVARGQEFYAELLGSAPWIALYFPRLYDLKTGPARRTQRDRQAGGGRPDLTNLFLYHVVGSYIRLKATWHNRLLVKTNKPSVFQAKLGPDHLVYESARYLSLREIYSRIKPVNGSEPRESVREEDNREVPARSH